MNQVFQVTPIPTGPVPEKMFQNLNDEFLEIYDYFGRKLVLEEELNKEDVMICMLSEHLVFFRNAAEKQRSHLYNERIRSIFFIGCFFILSIVALISMGFPSPVALFALTPITVLFFQEIRLRFSEISYIVDRELLKDELLLSTYYQNGFENQVTEVKEMMKQRFNLQYHRPIYFTFTEEQKINFVKKLRGGGGDHHNKDKHGGGGNGQNNSPRHNNSQQYQNDRQHNDRQHFDRNNQQGYPFDRQQDRNQPRDLPLVKKY